MKVLQLRFNEELVIERVQLEEEKNVDMVWLEEVFSGNFS